MKRITSARAAGGYRIDLRFDDDVRGIADLSDLAGRGVFAAWSEPGQFESVAIGSAGELTWPCGADLCPDALYLRVTGKTAADLFPSLGGPEARCA
jgi:Protein of unknown function (DUF2442)